MLYSTCIQVSPSFGRMSQTMFLEIAPAPIKLHLYTSMEAKDNRRPGVRSRFTSANFSWKKLILLIKFLKWLAYICYQRKCDSDWIRLCHKSKEVFMSCPISLFCRALYYQSCLVTFHGGISIMLYSDYLLHPITGFLLKHLNKIVCIIFRKRSHYCFAPLWKVQVLRYRGNFYVIL